MDFRHGAILWWIPWLYLSVSVAAGQDGRKLTGAVGGDITLPAAVETSGYLDYRDNNIAQVFKGDIEIYYKDFKDRLEWDRQTGLFTIRDLKINDTGRYGVKDSTRQNNSMFHLTVYNQVSKPQLRPAAPCWLECSVENGRVVNLSWYRGEERLNHISSADLSRVLSLVLVSDSNTSYSCVVENPVSTESISISDTCRTTHEQDGDARRTRVFTGVGVFCVALFIVLLVVFLKRKKAAHTQQGSDYSDRPQPQEQEVEYTEVTQVSKRKDQCNLPELVPCIEKDRLNTVYDMIQPHPSPRLSPATSHEDEDVQ